eukprot:30234-Pelagococcus_subviridis.AAC.5
MSSESLIVPRRRSEWPRRELGASLARSRELALACARSLKNFVAAKAKDSRQSSPSPLTTTRLLIATRTPPRSLSPASTAPSASPRPSRVRGRQPVVLRAVLAEGRSIRSEVGVEFKGVRSGVERQRGRRLNARDGRRETPGEKVLKERRSPRERGRMSTSPVDGRAVASGGEKQQPPLLRLGHGVNDSPEHSHRRIILRVAVFVSRRRFQRVEVEVRAPAHELFELLGAEKMNHGAAAQPVESSLERVERILDGVDEEPLDVGFDVRAAVLDRDGHVATVFDQIDDDLVAEDDSRRGKRQPKRLRETLVPPRVHLPQVPHARRLAQQLPVDGHREPKVEDVLVINRQADDDADELELHVLEPQIVRLGGEPERPRLVVVREHPERRVEHSTDEELEELLRDAALVHALLAHERHLQRLAEISLAFARNLRQHVLDQGIPPHPDDEKRRIARPREDAPHHRLLKLARHQHPALQGQDSRLGRGIERERRDGAKRKSKLRRAPLRIFPPSVVVLHVEERLVVHRVVVKVGVRQMHAARPVPGGGGGIRGGVEFEFESESEIRLVVVVVVVVDRRGVGVVEHREEPHRVLQRPAVVVPVLRARSLVHPHGHELLRRLRERLEPAAVEPSELRG